MNSILYKIAAARKRGRRMGIASGIARARLRMERPAPEYPDRLAAGELIGVLRWHGIDGRVRKWAIRQAPRRNQILIGNLPPHGWDFLFQRLRSHLAELTR